MIFRVVVSLVWACAVHAAAQRGTRGGGDKDSGASASRHDQPWDGSSYFGFQTLFQITRKERVQLKENAVGVKYLNIEGELSYPEEDGSVRRVQYRTNDLSQQVDILTNEIGEDAGDYDDILTNQAVATADGQLWQAAQQADNLLVFFPTEESDTTTPPNSIPVAADESNENWVDYYYDGLRSRKGTTSTLPPVILNSLLGPGGG